MISMHECVDYRNRPTLRPRNSTPTPDEPAIAIHSDSTLIASIVCDVPLRHMHMVSDRSRAPRHQRCQTRIATMVREMDFHHLLQAAMSRSQTSRSTLYCQHGRSRDSRALRGRDHIRVKLARVNVFLRPRRILVPKGNDVPAKRPEPSISDRRTSTSLCNQHSAGGRGVFM